MSDSGSGRYARNIADAAVDPASEPLPDPWDAAVDALATIGWLREPDRQAIAVALDRAGLTFCWKVP